MDFVNKAFAQLSDLFRSMTPGARITTGLLLVGVVISLGYLFNHQGTSADEELMGGEPISASQLPSMEAAFAKANLNTYQIEGNRIRVPRSQKAAYMGALADAGALPEKFNAYLQSTLDKSGPFVSKQKQEEMLKVATQSELALILRSMKGIENASVLYDIQTDGGIRGKKILTASVSVKPVGNLPLEEERVPAIRQLVAGAIAGLTTDNVSVTDLNSSRFFPPGNGFGGAGGATQLSQAKNAFEKSWEEKIRQALSYVPGVVVTANVEVNPEIDHFEEKTELDPKAVQVSHHESTQNTKSQTSSPSGRVGAGGPNGIVSSNTAVAVSGAAGGNASETEHAEADDKSVYGQKVARTVKAGLTPDRVSVSIGVPSNYFQKIWYEQHPTAASEEAKAAADPAALDKLTKARLADVAEIEKTKSAEIQKHVEKLLPHPAVATVGQDVTVTTFQSLTATPLAAPSIADAALGWLGHYWSTLGMCGLGLVSLVMLRSMVRSVAANEPASLAPAYSASTPQDREPETPNEPAVQEAQARLKRRVKGGPSLRDELSEIVREDPDAAAAILRTWIGAAT